MDLVLGYLLDDSRAHVCLFKPILRLICAILSLTVLVFSNVFVDPSLFAHDALDIDTFRFVTVFKQSMLHGFLNLHRVYI